MNNLNWLHKLLIIPNIELFDIKIGISLTEMGGAWKLTQSG